MTRFRITPTRAAVASLAFVAAWPAAAWCAELGEQQGVADSIRLWGWLLTYVLGLGWLIWGAERIARRLDTNAGRFTPVSAKTLHARRFVWNPCDTEAWYYGRRSPRLVQTLALLTSYSLAFLLLYFLLNLPSASGDGPKPFDLPSGGGSDQAAPAPRTVRVQKIQRKKYVINPYSALAFNPPTIDTVNLRVGEETRHEYRAGYGDGTGTGEGGLGRGFGKGSGFGSGSGSGEVRLPRL